MLGAGGGACTVITDGFEIRLTQLSMLVHFATYEVTPATVGEKVYVEPVNIDVSVSARSNQVTVPLHPLAVNVVLVPIQTKFAEGVTVGAVGLIGAALIITIVPGEMHPPTVFAVTV
jgi:hypothetical protein